MQEITCKTISEVLKIESAPLATIAALNKQTAQALLTIMLNNFLDFINVGKSMDGNQVVETVNLILSDKDFVSFKPEDFKVCFDEMKRGKYLDKGKLFDRIDGVIIIQSLYQYANDRADIAESISIQMAKELKVVELNQETNTKILEVLKSAIKEIPKDEKKEGSLKQVSTRDPRITEALNEFDKIYEQQNKGKSKDELLGIKFILFGKNNRQINVTEFLEYKLLNK